MKKLLFLLLISLPSFAATTWTGLAWSNGTPAFNDDVVINGNYTVGVSNGATNFFCKSIIINAGYTFRIKTGFYMNVGNNAGAGNLTNNGTFIVESGADFWIYVGNLINNSSAANFLIESGGAFIQLNNAAVNSGAITFKRNTNPVKQFEYTYWSSPVSGKTMCSLPPFSNINAFSYTYPTPLPMNGWIAENCSNTMTLGKGYAVRGAFCSPYPSCFAALPQVTHTADFVGVPNNGVINIVSNSTNNLHLLGNPYGSSLRASSFMTTNPSVSAIYFWTHNTLLSSSIAGNWQYNFTNDDYAIYNSTGGVGATSPISDGTPNNSNVPNGNIGTAQGFFVRCNTNGAKTFTFHNGQRGYLPTSNNVQFFRDAEVEKHRVWLFLTNNSTITRYSLIGYVTGADNSLNHQYDAELMGNNVNALYSVLGESDLAIQGRQLPFDYTDRIPLGYKLAEGGSFQIGLNAVDGLFEDTNQPVLLEDVLLGVTHDLRISPYSFSAAQGIVENRFILKFTNSTLGNEEFVVNSCVIYKEGESVIVKNNSVIESISVFDVLGREIFAEKNLKNNTITINNLPKGILLFKVNRTVKKFINN